MRFADCFKGTADFPEGAHKMLTKVNIVSAAQRSQTHSARPPAASLRRAARAAGSGPRQCRAGEGGVMRPQGACAEGGWQGRDGADSRIPSLGVGRDCS